MPAAGGVSFNGISGLAGGAADDSFVLNGGTVSGLISGGAGSNSLTADNVANTWNITGANAGQVDGASGGFNQIQDLIGGSLTNAFSFSDGASVNSINGTSAQANNSISYSAYSSPIKVTLTGNDSGAVMNNSSQFITNSFDNIGTLVGSQALGSSITVPNKAGNVVDVSGFMQGAVNDPINFSNFNTIIGQGAATNTLVNFQVFATLYKNSGYAIINGQTMYFQNVTFGGNFTQADAAPASSGIIASTVGATVPFIYVDQNTSSVPGVIPSVDIQTSNNINDIIQEQTTLDYQISWLNPNC